jgi:hypothetical protein
MPDLFQKFFRSSSKTKGSTLVNTPSATPHASTSHTTGDSTVNLNLVASPMVEGYKTDIQNELKQQCIAHGITALELLKEISEGNGVLASLKAISGVTLAILNTIEVDLLSLSLLRRTDRYIQDMDSNKEAWKEVSNTLHKNRDVFEQQLHSVTLDQIRPDLDRKLLASIQIYARYKDTYPL